MAFKCKMTCYAGRLYEEGVLYDSIGKAESVYFENLQAVSEVEVVETGLVEEPAGAPFSPPVDDEAKAEAEAPITTEREEIEAALTELGAEFKAKTPMHVLRSRLMKAQQEAMLG